MKCCQAGIVGVDETHQVVKHLLLSGKQWGFKCEGRCGMASAEWKILRDFLAGTVISEGVAVKGHLV